MKNFVIVFLVFVSSAFASVKVHVNNIGVIKGNLMVGIYSRQDDLQKRAGVKGVKETIVSSNMTVVVTDLPPGWYMIAVFHDINSNGKLDSNVIGIPSEPYGFSKNRMGLFGPSFEKSKFYYSGKDMEFEILLK